MPPRLKSFLLISAKHAVNAILTNSALMTFLGNWSQLHHKAGWIFAAKTAAAVILSREAIVWGPKVLAWSQSVNEDQPASSGAATGK